LEDSKERQSGLRSTDIVEGRLLLVLNNTIAAVEDGQRELFRFLQDRPLTSRGRHRIEVLFEELVSNTIRHGFTKGSNQSIRVTVEQKSGTVELTFEDDGKPFNPLQAEPPDAFSSIDTARIGGLGIPLIAGLSAELRYEQPRPAATREDVSTPPFMPCNRIVVSVTI
jgi:serine/threonine-protein kinase RsbW